VNPKRSAAAENARRRREAPLLAAHGLIPMVTPDEREAEMVAARAVDEARQAAIREKLEAAAERHRAEVIAHVSPTVLSNWERRLAALPAAVEYRADFWHSRKRELGLCTPDASGFGCRCSS
jgi:hypothetical protein